MLLFGKGAAGVEVDPVVAEAGDVELLAFDAVVCAAAAGGVGAGIGDEVDGPTLIIRPTIKIITTL